MRVFLIMAFFAFCGCISTVSRVREDACAGAPDALPDLRGDCTKEICVDGRIVAVEDLDDIAPVSGWAEEKFCFVHPVDCFRALKIKRREFVWEQNMASDGHWERKSLYNGLGDAARHAYLGCSLTERLGREFAEKLLDAHEDDSLAFFGFGERREVNKCCEKLMDLYNGRIGMNLAHKPGTCEEKVMNSLNTLRYSLCKE